MARGLGTVYRRTDGEHLLVWTDSALATLKEAYRFDLSAAAPSPVEVRPI